MNTRATQLTAAYVDNTISVEERTELLDLLRSDRNLATEFLGQLVLHRELAFIFQEDEASERRATDRILYFLEANRTAKEFMGKVKQRIHPRPLVSDRQKAIRSGKAFRWMVIPLAAAAAVAVVFWLFNISVQRVEYVGDRIARVERKIGRVDVSGNRVSTGSDSACVLEYGADTFVVLDQRSKARLHGYQQAASKVIELAEGRIYVDAARQTKPFLVKSGDTSVEVLGTKLQITNRNGLYVDVFDGKVRYMLGDMNAYVGGCKSIAPTSYVVEDPAPCITVKTLDPDKQLLSWVAGLGVEIPNIPVLARQRTPRTGRSLIDFGNYKIFWGGVWKVEHTEAGTVIRQEVVCEEAAILFGKPKWRQGTVEFKCRVLKTSGDPGIGAWFQYSSGTREGFAATRSLAQALKHDNWVAMRYNFEITTQKKLVIRSWSIWPVNKPDEIVIGRNMMSRQETKRTRICCVGVGTANCAAEISDFRLTEAK